MPASKRAAHGGQLGLRSLGKHGGFTCNGKPPAKSPEVSVSAPAHHPSPVHAASGFSQTTARLRHATEHPLAFQRDPGAASRPSPAALQLAAMLGKQRGREQTIGTAASPLQPRRDRPCSLRPQKEANEGHVPHAMTAAAQRRDERRVGACAGSKHTQRRRALLRGQAARTTRSMPTAERQQLALCPQRIWML